MAASTVDVMSDDNGGVVSLGLCRVTRERSVLKCNVAASVFLSVHWASDSEGAWQ